MTPENIEGCLLGALDEYLETFEEPIARLNARFEINHQRWQSQIDQSA